MEKEIRDMTHEEKLQLLKDMKERAEAESEKMKKLLAWFIDQTTKRKG